jgi:hypothetical protein
MYYINILYLLNDASSVPSDNHKMQSYVYTQDIAEPSVETYHRRRNLQHIDYMNMVSVSSATEQHVALNALAS